MENKKIMPKKVPTKLNLGCGRDHRDGYCNIDALSAVDPDLVHDLLNPLPFKDSSIVEVMAQDILEHFIYDDCKFVISEIARVLQVGGVLRVRVPNVDAIIEHFDEDPDVRNIFLYGSTSHRTDSGVFGAHKIGFTKKRLIAELGAFDLQLESIVTVDTNFEAVFRKKEAQKSKKLLFLHQSLSLGGAEVFDRDILAACAAQKYTVQAYTSNVPFAAMLEKEGIPTRVSIPVIDFIGDYKGLLKALFLSPWVWLYYGKLIHAHRDSSVLLLSGFPEKIFASFWARFFGVPLVWIEYGPLSSVLHKHFSLPKVLYRLCKNLPQRVIVPSEHTMRDLTQSGRVSLAKMHVIPCGSTEKPVAGYTDRKKPIVVCVSRLEKGKGQDILIEAFGSVVKSVPSAKLHIVGEGSFEAELVTLVKKHGLEKSVQFLGRVSSVRDELIKAQVVVFPSQWELEGFGLVTIEAMALAKPVIAFNRAPTNEIITNGSDGFLVADMTVESLFEQIVSLLKNATTRKKLGTQALATYTKKYRMPQIAKQYIHELKLAAALVAAEERIHS